MAITQLKDALRPFAAIVPWESKGAYRYTKNQLTEPKYWFRMSSLNPSNWRPFNK